MSKIGRIYQGLEEIQKYYKGGVLQKLFFDWKHYIGTELNIEYGKECAGRNVVINGKTYQNLAILKEEYIKQYGSNVISKEIFLETNSISITTTTVNNAVSGFLFSSQYYLFKPSTRYTLECDVDFGDTTITNALLKEVPSSATHGVLKSGHNKIIFTTLSDLNYLAIGYTSRTVDDIVKINNIKILEGDYTNTDIPDNIDGIESVGEREFVKSKNLVDTSKITRWSVNPNLSTHLEYPEFIKVKESTTYITNMEMNCVFFYDKDKNKIGESMQPNAGIFTTPSGCTFIKIRTWGSSSPIYPEDYAKFQLEEGTTSTDYKPFYEYYPATIRNYNYKCETDGVVLPNGVKNSIDIIDGKKVHVQRVGKVVLDGGKNFKLSTLNTHKEVIRISYVDKTIKVGKNNSICDNFLYEYTDSDKVHYKLGLASNTAFFYIPIEYTKNPNSYFEQNPTVLYYEFIEPIYTYLESGLYDDITLPDGTKNEINYTSGKHIYTRKIDKVIFDGSDDENWGTSSLTPQNESIIFQSALISNKVVSNSSLLCDVYDTLPDFSTDDIEGIRMGGTNNSRIYIRIKRSNLETEDIDGFKSYLQENPFTVYFSLAEPVITELYYNDITYKLNEPLRSLPNGVCDTIEEGKMIRRTGHVLLEDISGYTLTDAISSYNRIGVILDDAVKDSSRYPIISDRFFSSHDNALNINGGAFSASSKIYVCLGLSTVDEYIEWFKNNPTNFIYPLETPIETKITPDMVLITGEAITDTVGIELPDGTCDSIENEYYIKRLGKVTFDGSDDEVWKNGYTDDGINNRFQTEIYNYKSNGIKYGLCDKFSYSYTSEIPPVGSFRLVGSSNTLYLLFNPSTDIVPLKNVSAWKTWLSGNPITVWYELATPVKIPLFSIKEGLTVLKSTNNITPQIELDCLVREGFQNLCDNVWEVGNINANTGENEESDTNIRLINYIEVKPNTAYRLDITNRINLDSSIEMIQYDSSKNFISVIHVNDKQNNSIIVTDSNCYYIKLITSVSDTNFKIYLNEIRIKNKLQYLQATGKQYIDTGIKIPQNFRIVVCSKWGEAGKNTEVFGASHGGLDTGNSRLFRLFYYNTGIIYDLWIRCSVNFTRDDVFHEYEITNSTICADGNTLRKFTPQDLDYSTWTTITLFATVGGVSDVRGYCSVKYFKIYDGTNKLVMSLVPCLDDKGIPCMYDYVSQKYFYNKETGENFLYG